MKTLTRIFIFLLTISIVYAQENLPKIKSNVPVISVRDGEQFRPNAWRLAPEAKPDVYQAGLINSEAHKVTFITDVDSIGFMVEEGKSYDFIIEFNGQLCYTQIVGKRFIPAAVFDETYRKTNRGKISIEIPEVYELVNVAIALTDLGLKNNNYVFQKSEYYKEMREWFDPFKEDRLVVKLDSLFRQNSGFYATIKMNGNAFLFNENNQIVQSPVYERTGFTGERSNSLRPYLKEMQSFAEATDFRSFYKKHLPLYESQIAFYRDTADIREMQRWLNEQFPGADPYDFYKIIFSPLVSYNQSVTWFESNGFRELQPHVNFPYPSDFRGGSLGRLSAESERIFRGNIVFTELNHGYINPEADKYFERVAKAVSNRHRWVEKSRPDNYYAGNAVFNEYMNWGLVSLRIMDYTSQDEWDKMLGRVERMMVKSRGFIMFEEFNQFLTGLYKNRKAGQTLADLYPQIISWFDENNNSQE